MFQIKDFLNRVQDGLTTNTNLKKTLLEAQKIKLLYNDKQKVLSERKVDLNAGSELLDKYQSDWREIHNTSERNMKTLQIVDELILKIHDETERRLKASKDICFHLKNIPLISAKIDECMKFFMELQISLNTVEEEMNYLENIVEGQKLAQRKSQQYCQLNLYKEQKLELLQKERMSMEKLSSDRNALRLKQQKEERERRHLESQMAFQEDMNRYRSTGLVPASDKTDESIKLEQIDLDIEEGQLENFLNS